jgi:GNAT superfamily N-acetyltransferase
MNLEISTRIAAAQDAERVASLIAGFRDEKGYKTQTTVPLPVDHRGPLYLLLAETADGALVGIAAVQRGHQLVKGTSFFQVTDMYVVEDYRRHGVAVALLNECIALGRREGSRLLKMTVDEADSAMLATAERAGFVTENGRFLALDLTL